MKTEIKFAIGDRVKRKPRKGFYTNDKIGTIIEIDEYHRAKIKWDVKEETGQQHSTINLKTLLHID